MTIRMLIVCGGSGINLLGQRQVLGADVALYVDVSNAQGVQPPWIQDSRCFIVEPDRNILTTALLFQETLGRIVETGQIPREDEGVSEYLQRGIYYEQDARHARFLVSHTVANVDLRQGLAQSPAIGGLCIRHSANRSSLERTFNLALSGMGLGPDNPLEVWIISSTVGGTGAGMHRFIAVYLADFMHRWYRDTPVQVNFIQVGQLTYRTVNAQQTALSTFFSVAADVALALKAREEFPWLVTHWFYMDVPDVGTGEQSVSMRARMVEIAAKAVMLEDLRTDLLRLLLNNSGIPMVPIRVGYWERDLGDRRKYYETLRQLRAKLQRLVQPDYKLQYIEGRRVPRFEGGKELDDLKRRASDIEYIRGRMEAGWRFRYRLRHYPESLDALREVVARWKESLRDLLGEDLDRTGLHLITERIVEQGGQIQREVAPLRLLSVREIELGQQEWFRQIEGAHEAIAWSRYLLGCDFADGIPRRGGLENRTERLLKEAQEVSRACCALWPLRRNSARAREAAGKLKEFLQTLLEVDLLLRLEQEARNVLTAEMSIPQEILEAVNREFQTIWKELTQPDYTTLVGSSDEYIFQDDALAPWLERARDEQNALTRLEQGWRFPFSFWGAVPPDLKALGDQIAKWRQAVTEFIGLDWEQFHADLLIRDITGAEGERRGEMRALRVSALIDETDEWGERIAKAHRVRAIAWMLLGLDLQTEKLRRDDTLVGALLGQARKIAWTLHGFPFLTSQREKAKRLAHFMPEFLRLLARVNILLNLANQATAALETELQEKGSAIFVSDLSTPVEYTRRMSWLQLLQVAVRKGDPQWFKHVVLQGAAGLTEVGLRYVLGLRPRVGMREIFEELASHMGQIADDKGQIHEAPWWAGQPLTSTLSYEYRILPPVTSTLREALLSAAESRTAAFRFVFTSALSELVVVALSGASLAGEFGDVVTAPQTLLAPFIPAVKGTLEKWEHSLGGVPVGQLAMVSAGVGGEPLAEEAMRAAGLEDTDIEKIAHYYRLTRYMKRH